MSGVIFSLLLHRSQFCHRSAMFLENVAAKLLQMADLRCVCEALPWPVVSWERSSLLLGQRGRGAAALRSLIQELHFIEPSWRGLGPCPRRLDMWPEAGFLTAEPRPLWPPGRCHHSLCCWGSREVTNFLCHPAGCCWSRCLPAPGVLSGVGVCLLQPLCQLCLAWPCAAFLSGPGPCPVGRGICESHRALLAVLGTESAVYRGLQARWSDRPVHCPAGEMQVIPAMLTCTSAHRHQGSSSERVCSGLCADLGPQAAAAQWWVGWVMPMNSSCFAAKGTSGELSLRVGAVAMATEGDRCQ